jgi:Tfp pilus assembly protein PilZ
MTVHVVEPENAKGRIAGIGVQFYALDQPSRESWDTFVRHVEAHCPESPDQTPLRLPRGFTPEPIRRRFERHTAVLKVEPVTQAELEEIYTRDVLTGSMFVPTRLELPAGTRVVVYVSHPTSGQPFLFEASVVHGTGSAPRVTGAVTRGVTGLGLELLGIDRRCKDAFLDFVRAGIFIDEEVIRTRD